GPRPELGGRELPSPRGVGEVEAEPARGEIPEPAARARIAARVPDEERLELGVVAAEEAPRGELEVHAGRVPLVRHDLRRSGRRGAPRVDRAEGRLLEDPPLEPRDREVLAGNLQGPVVGEERVSTGGDLVEADLVRARLPGVAASVADGDGTGLAQADPPRAEGHRAAALREREDARALEEEVTLLGEALREAGEVDLTLVALDLGEVGVEAHR